MKMLQKKSSGRGFYRYCNLGGRMAVAALREFKKVVSNQLDGGSGSSDGKIARDRLKLKRSRGPVIMVASEVESEARFK